MDEEMSFPNPVERHDLPVKKPRWPKVLAGLAVVGLLVVVFLPQLLHTKPGKRLMRSRLESRFNAEVSIGILDELVWRHHGRAVLDQDGRRTGDRIQYH